MVEQPLRVMVVDNHAVVRSALVAVLATAADLVVCAEAASVHEAEEKAQALEPDVVVVDLHLGDGTGIGASRRIRDHRPSTQVILLTAASDQDALYASILAGAAAYLPKQLRGIDLVGTIRAVAGGARLLDPDDVERLVKGRAEQRLLSLLAEGRTDRDLRRVLGLDDAVLGARLDRLAETFGRSRPQPSFAMTTSDNGVERTNGSARS